MAVPFIQLFKTPRSQYIFDANMSEIIPVSAESFLFLRKCMSGETDVASSSIAEIQELIQAGYLKTESVVQEIRHPYTPHLKYFLDRKLSKITLQVTQGCNLRCKYCIYSEDINKNQRAHSNKKMRWETAKKSIDFLWEHSIDSEKVNVAFYGGEPLLEFPLIKRAIEYSQEMFDGKELSFSITTNGTLLNEEIIDFFAHNNVSLTISLDGPKKIHDKSRVFANGEGSFDTVMEKVELLKAIAPEYSKSLSFSMVMDPANDFDCINEITTAAEDFNEHSFMATIIDRDYDEEGNIVFCEEYVWKVAYQQFLAFLSTIGRYPSNQVSALSQSIVSTALNDFRKSYNSAPLKRIDVPSGPCIPGQLRLFVNVDGLLFPCERVSEKSSAMIIGTLDDGLDVKKASYVLNVGALTQDRCKKCWCFRHCTMCAKRADTGGTSLSPEFKLGHCPEIQANAYEKIERLILLNEISLYYSKQIRKGKGEHIWRIE